MFPEDILQQRLQSENSNTNETVLCSLIHSRLTQQPSSKSQSTDAVSLSQYFKLSSITVLADFNATMYFFYLHFS